MYIRSYRGRNGSWSRSARARHQGHIQAGGVRKDVTFAEETDSGVNDQIDHAYGTKYGRHSSAYVHTMVTPEARATTIGPVPR